MVSGRTLIISAVRCYGQTRTRAASIPISDLELDESTVGVALGSHLAERKRVRAGGVRNSVFLHACPANSMVCVCVVCMHGQNYDDGTCCSHANVETIHDLFHQ